MKQFILLLVLSCLITHNGKLYSQPNAAEIRSEKDLQNFFNRWYFKDKPGVVQRWKPIPRDGYTFEPDSAAFAYYQKGKYKTWIKQDLNRDGKKDLLFGGLVNEQSLLLVFFSTDTGYYYQRLNAVYDDGWNMIPFIRYLRKMKAVETGLINAGWGGGNSWQPDPEMKSIRIDTLRMRKDRLLEYSFGQREQKPDSFRLRYSVSIRPTRLEWIFTKDSQVYLSSMERMPSDTIAPWQELLYRLQVSPDTLRQIWNFCTLMPSTAGGKAYYSNLDIVLDGYSWRLTLYYPNGKSQLYAEHMRSGPLFLDEFISSCERLRLNCKKEFVRRLR